MLARLARLFRSLTQGAALALPLKGLAGFVVSLVVPYLLYAFLGGFGLAIALVLVIWGIVYLVKKKDS